MLCLTRKVGERIDVTSPGGYRMSILIVSIDVNKVRVAFEAGPEFEINRREITKLIESNPNGDAK